MIDEQVADFIKESLAIPNFQLTAITGGANNQGFKISYRGNSWFLKLFAQDQTNSLRKMKSEFAFYSELVARKVQSIAKPIALSELCLATIYEFIEGNKVSQVTEHHVIAAVDFVTACNPNNNSKPAIAAASESVNSLHGFIDIVTLRLARFRNDSLEHQALIEQLNRIDERLTNCKNNIDKSWSAPFDQLLLSASDFGFHNAIESDHGLFFIDFEYAGLDSCWKLLADFYSQPQYPVPISSIKHFFNSPLFEQISLHKDTFLKVFELTQLKWCLIMLNEFLPEIQRRRQFAWNKTCLKSQLEMSKDSQSAQLIKSINYFNDIDSKLIELKTSLQEI